MSRALCVKIALGAAALVLIALLGSSWLQSRDALAELRATIAAQEKVISRIDDQIAARDQQATNQVKQLRRAAEKVISPALALKAMPEVADLPSPIILPPTIDVAAETYPDGRLAIIPQESILPLYRQLERCKENEIVLGACQATRSDLDNKVSALETERDAALKASHGGGFWKRLKANAKWFAIGEAAGAVTAYAATR